MNIFMTGATGYVGNALALALANQGHTVHALVRTPAKAHVLKHPNIQLFEGHLMAPQKLEQAMKGCQQVYHLAAFARVWAKDPQTFYQLNVTGTQNVLNAALAQGVQRVVFTSTAGTLGPSKQEEPVTEESQRWAPFFSDYESTKKQAEELAFSYVPKGLEVVVVNPSRVYGPGLESESNAVSTLIDKYRLGKWRFYPGNGHGIGNYVFINDLVAGHIQAMEKGQSGQLYALGGVNASYRTLFDTVAKLTGKKYKLIVMPLWAMLLFARIQVLMQKLTGRPPLITPGWVKKYNHHWVLSSQKAVQHLGYRMVSLEEGVQKTLDWLQAGKTQHDNAK